MRVGTTAGRRLSVVIYEVSSWANSGTARNLATKRASVDGKLNLICYSNRVDDKLRFTALG